MRLASARRWWLVGVLLLGAGGGPAQAGDRALWQAGSDAVVPFVVLGELSLLGSGKRGGHEAWQGFQALAVTAAETEALKRLTRERRPDHSGRDSFPSLHASTAFTMATVISQYHPEYTWLAFGTASAISYSRVRLNKHHWQDVIAGAGLGYLNGRLFAHHHVAVTPQGVVYHTSF